MLRERVAASGSKSPTIRNRGAHPSYSACDNPMTLRLTSSPGRAAWRLMPTTREAGRSCSVPSSSHFSPGKSIALQYDSNPFSASRRDTMLIDPPARARNRSITSRLRMPNDEAMPASTESHRPQRASYERRSCLAADEHDHTPAPLVVRPSHRGPSGEGGVSATVSRAVQLDLGPHAPTSTTISATRITRTQAGIPTFPMDRRCRRSRRARGALAEMDPGSSA